MTWTVSPFLMRSFAISEHLRSQRNDLHELLFAELTADGPEDAGPARVAVAAQDDCRVLVEANVRTVGAAALLDGADDDRLDDVALLDVAAGDRVLDGGDDDVADTGVAAARTAEHADAQNLLGTRVVGDPKSRLLLDHFSFPSSRRFSGEPGGTRCGRCPPGLPCLLGALEDLDDPPPLRRRERPRLADEDEVADAGGVALVVRIDLARSPQDLAVEGVLDPVLGLDDDGLVHLVADDVAAPLLAVAAGLRPGARPDGVPGGLRHRSARGRARGGGTRRGGRRLVRGLSHSFTPAGRR